MNWRMGGATLVLLALWQIGWAEETARICNLIETEGVESSSPGLTPFWAQEYIGTDLLDLVGTKKRDHFSVEIGVIDHEFNMEYLSEPHTYVLPKPTSAVDHPNLYRSEGDNHGTKVTNLIRARPPFGVGLRLAQYFLWDARDNSIQHLDEPLHFDIVNACFILSTHALRHGLEARNTLLALFDDLISANTILMAGAGNDYPFALDRDFTKQNSLITVGNLAYDGLVDHTSVEGEYVDILAPAGGQHEHQITLKNPDGIFHFGQTSGATPLVTGILGHAMTIAGKLYLEEALILLKETAIETLNTRQAPRLNGHGTVNALKMAMTANRLRSQDFSRVAELEERASLLGNPDLYDFRVSAARFYQQGRELLEETSCEDQREGFRQLRAAFLLDGRDRYRKDLINHYESQGYWKNALFYRSLGEQNSLTWIVKLRRIATLKDSLWNEAHENQMRILRNTRGYGINPLPLLFEFRDNADDIQVRHAAEQEIVMHTNKSGARKVLDEHLVSLKAMDSAVSRFAASISEIPELLALAPVELSLDYLPRYLKLLKEEDGREQLSWIRLTLISMAGWIMRTGNKEHLEALKEFVALQYPVLEKTFSKEIEEEEQIYFPSN